MVNTRWQEVSEADILAANIQKYADDKIIDFYANIDELQFPYVEYTVVFNAVLDMLGRGRRIKAVDMCGGAGRASFILKECDPDCDLTLVDCADKMLAVAEQKAEQMDVQDIKIVKQDAFSFLKEAEQFDLIIFSSAIHHFKDPVELLHSASSRLTPGGLMVTIADPTIPQKRPLSILNSWLLSPEKNDCKNGSIKYCRSSKKVTPCLRCRHCRISDHSEWMITVYAEIYNRRGLSL